MTKIKPLADRVVLKSYVENKAVTESGIYLPQNDKKEVSFMYEVLEIGEKVKTVKIGEIVLCGQYSGDEIKLDWENYKIVSVDYLLAIIWE